MGHPQGGLARGGRGHLEPTAHAERVHRRQRRRAPENVLVAIMVGDLQRIRLYALPPRSFQIPQPIPRKVWEAYAVLVRNGFVMNLVQTEEPLEWAPLWMDCTN